MKTSEWIKLWLSSTRRNRSKNTVHAYERLSKHFAPLANVELESLTASMVLQWHLSLDLPEPTRKQVGVILRACLSMAVKMQLLDSNPTDPLSRAKPTPKFKAMWSKDELHTFLKATEASKYPLLFWLAVSTGLRLGELLGLKYEDFKPNGELYVTRQVLEIDGVRMIGKPKTGERRIKVSAEDLRRVGKGRGFLFLTRANTNLTRAMVYTELHAAIARASLTPARFHDLRHLSASFLLSEGVPIPVVSKRLGHSRVSTTLDIYAHSLPDGQEEAADKMEEVLK